MGPFFFFSVRCATFLTIVEIRVTRVQLFARLTRKGVILTMTFVPGIKTQTTILIGQDKVVGLSRGRQALEEIIPPVIA